MELLNETAKGSAGVVGKPSRQPRSGIRLWSEAEKGRAVFESMQPGVRVCEVARRCEGSTTDGVAEIGTRRQACGGRGQRRIRVFCGDRSKQSRQQEG